jgi:hypothetical protein
LSLALFIPFVYARREPTVSLTHMSWSAQVMLHQSNSTRSNGNRLG